MKKFSFRSVLPLICAFSIVVSLCTISSSAVWYGDDVVDLDSASAIDAKMKVPSSWDLEIAIGSFKFLDLDLGSTFKDFAWKLIDDAVDSNGVGEMSLVELQTVAARYTSFFNHSPAYTFVGAIAVGTADIVNNVLSLTLFGKMGLTFEVRSWGKMQYKRIYCPELDVFVSSSAGRYAYVNEGYTDTSGGAQWIPISVFDDRNVKKATLDYTQLYNTATALGYKPVKYHDYWIIQKTANASGTAVYVYADEEGRPYVAPYDKNQTATSTTRPTTSVKDENGEDVEVPENSSSNIDLSGMTVTLPDGTFNFIDQLIYDESTKTYYIDSHDTYTTNNNYYVTNNYSWTYHINYTSITYIGQTAEYDKYYEVYYELPDGRDSADLTKEEVEQLNVNVDVIPYGRSADDTSLRSLYHFDGDTRDASYWNYCTDFTWNKGASLTYMDAGAFNGALYLDETEHDFTLTLPSAIGAGDFTLQFRYYQSYTAAPQMDSYIKFGSSTLLQLNGGSFYTASGSEIAVTPVGSWNEVALIRESGRLYFYVNGVRVGFVSMVSVFSDTITFHFGSTQQTFKYLDELRVLNYALTSGGANYECTSVPFDTNLTLILPTDSAAVADEYWSIQSSHENLLSEYGMDYTNSNFLASDYFNQVTASADIYKPKKVATTDMAFKYPTWSSYCGFNSLVSSDTSLTVMLDSSHSDYINAAVSYLPFSYSSTYKYCSLPSAGFFSVINAYWLNDATSGVRFLPAGTYTLSLVFEDGEVASVTFNCAFDDGYDFTWEPVEVAVTKSHGWTFGKYFYQNHYGSSPDYFRLGTLVVRPTEPDVYPEPIVYMELVKGNSTDLSAEWVESVTVMDKADLNTPTLAVRTDLDITSYQIGGVRPSLPSKGQVWCLVESERITSIQIYNGSAWEGVDGRIWTGERWIPASSYNIITLQDMYDIADATQDFEYIYSESGFWTWWQKSWNAFTEKLFSVLGSGGSGAAGGDGASGLLDVDLDTEDPSADPDEESSKSLWQFIVLVISGGKSVVGGTRELFSGVVSTIPDTMDQIVGAFDPGGIAVGALDGTSSDPDAADLPADPGAVSAESEVLDPWRYR